MDRNLRQTTIRVESAVLEALQRLGKKRRWNLSETIRAASEYWIKNVGEKVEVKE